MPRTRPVEPHAARTVTTGPRAERRAATRQRILGAAWQLSRERGLVGWALRDLAAAVGMRAPSLYVYFDGKHALYDALFADGYSALLARVDALQRSADPVRTLRVVGAAFLEFCVADEARFQLLFLRTVPGFVPSEESYALAVRALDGLREALADVGITDEQDVDLWTATMTGLASQQVSNDPGGDRWMRLVDVALDRVVLGSRR